MLVALAEEPQNPSFLSAMAQDDCSAAVAPDTTQLYIKEDRLYHHNLMRINYTTYDVRRKQDNINPRTPHRDIMVLGETEHNTDHPYLYGRVLGIFHANVVYTASRPLSYRPRRLEFLWVRWY